MRVISPLVLIMKIAEELEELKIENARLLQVLKVKYEYICNLLNGNSIGPSASGALPTIADIESNRRIEPFGESIREQIQSWVKVNNIGVLHLDLGDHTISIYPAGSLNSDFQPVLTSWGIITANTNPETMYVPPKTAPAIMEETTFSFLDRFEP